MMVYKISMIRLHKHFWKWREEEIMRNVARTEIGQLDCLNSREMIAWKRQWLALSRANRQREDAVEKLKEDYQRTIEHTENLTNRMWLSVGCTLIDNDTRHHSGQNVVDSRDAVRTFVFYHNIKHNEINLCLDS